MHARHGLLTVFGFLAGACSIANATEPPRRDAAVFDASRDASAASTDAHVAATGVPPAVACATVADCEVVPQRDESELRGGPCCAVCGGYEAVNRAHHASQPVCDPARRGACPVSCPASVPPPADCVAGRCVLVYPPVAASCSHDHECVVVPRLRPEALPGTCRLACGEYVAGNRTWNAYAAVLWENASVVGTCPSTCVDRPMPAATCNAGTCVLRRPIVISLARVDLRAPTVRGAIASADVVRVVSSAASRFQRCRERARPIGPIGYAGFEMHFEIGADGRIGALDPGAIATYLPDVSVCMVGVMRGLQFPRPTDAHSVSVVYPMGAAFDTH